MRLPGLIVNLNKRVKISMLTSRPLFAATLLIVGLASSAFSQQEKPARRLESITWNPTNHKLTWTVSQGALEKGKFVEKTKYSYEINMDEATMKANGEGRRFSKSEAVSVHALMDLVSKYAAESTLWWDAGQGEPLDKDGDSKVKRSKPGTEEENFIPEAPRRRDARQPKTIQIVYEQ
jgi:hypothetical protein